MLILGAQILLGFQLRGVFSDGYDQLLANARYLDGLALGLMVSVAGLLFYRVPIIASSWRGEDDPHFHRLVTAVADFVLLPFALALGLDVFRGCGNGMSDGKSPR